MENIAQFFPNGMGIYLAGGLLIGLGIVLIYVTTGLIAGASTFLESTLTFVSGHSHFRKQAESRGWRTVFTAGIVGGALIYALAIEGGAWVSQVQWWRLLAGGLLVGFGTRMGKGCTSGHGICGVASLSSASIVNVVVFVLVAIGVAQLMQAVGVAP